jgi:hypothetical protein
MDSEGLGNERAWPQLMAVPLVLPSAQDGERVARG